MNIARVVVLIIALSAGGVAAYLARGTEEKPRAAAEPVAQAFSTRLCRHCGAGLADGENEDECSSTFNLDAASILRTAQRKIYAE